MSKKTHFLKHQEFEFWGGNRLQSIFIVQGPLIYFPAQHNGIRLDHARVLRGYCSSLARNKIGPESPAFGPESFQSKIKQKQMHTLQKISFASPSYGQPNMGMRKLIILIPVSPDCRYRRLSICKGFFMIAFPLSQASFLLLTSSTSHSTFQTVLQNIFTIISQGNNGKAVL